MAETPTKKARKPRPIAYIDPQGCSGEPCQVCISLCPVDCIDLVGSHHGPDGHAHGFCVVDYDRCTGCSECWKFCPWETIYPTIKDEVDEFRFAIDDGAEPTSGAIFTDIR